MSQRGSTGRSKISSTRWRLATRITLRRWTHRYDMANSKRPPAKNVLFDERGDFKDGEGRVAIEQLAPISAPAIAKSSG